MSLFPKNVTDISLLGRPNYFHQYGTRFKEKFQEKLSVDQNKEKYLELEDEIENSIFNNMDRRRKNCNQNSWLKYFCGFCILSTSYLITQEMFNKQNFSKVFQELETLKQGPQDDTPADVLSKLQNDINNVRRVQELYQRSLAHMVRQEFDIYTDDKTGKADFALESTGGQIISLMPGTENFDSSKTVFGITLCEGMHGPRALLQAEMSPGHCWAFRGSQGGAVVKLMGKVEVTGVSLEHISANISPTGEVSSAPKDFSVWGLTDPNDRGQLLGTFHYDIDGPGVQTFPTPKSDVFEYIKFKIITNQGNPDFTCVYRLRVHGRLEGDATKS